MPQERNRNIAAAVSFAKEFVGGFAGIFTGMGVTLKYLVARRKVTVQYPYERLEVSPRYRGLFYLPFDEEANRLKCVGCTLCAQACPTKVISITKMGAGKHAGVSNFEMDLGRCMFCNLCIEACPFEAIYMGPAYELASRHRDASVFKFEHLAQGGEAAVEANSATIKAALAAEAEAKAKAAAEKAKAAAAAAAAQAKPQEAV